MSSKTPTFGQRAMLRKPPLEPRRTAPADLAVATDVPIPAVAPTMAVPASSETVVTAPEPTVAHSETGSGPAMALQGAPQGDKGSAEARWARRTPARLGAQILEPSLVSPILCTIRDTSSTGARLEVQVQRGGNISRDRVPDQFKLFMPADRLEVDCQVMWRQGVMMGVRYTSPTRRTVKQKPMQRPEAPKKPHTSLMKLLINPI